MPSQSTNTVQEQTEKLVNWLRERARKNGGSLLPFSNAVAASALGYGDMRRYGQAQGNLQSRVDFACFRANLPPLGMAAVEPFTNAWSQQDRSWAYPTASMQQAAQSRIWSDADFDQIVKELDGIPNRAHVAWKDATARQEDALKTWATQFGEAVLQRGLTTDPKTTTQRNPAWTRDELMLALDLYLRHRASPPGKDSREVAELSDLLKRLGTTLGQPTAETFRNANGVYMKMMNFRRFDGDYKADGKVGLTRGNKDEELVWQEFALHPERLAAAVTAIKAAVNAHQTDGELAGIDEPDIQEAEEGRLLTRLHRVRERSRKLVQEAKKAAFKRHGRLFCTACHFDFTEKYGAAGEGIIDVHHTKPVHTLGTGDVTRIEDLVLLCANCHRVVHSSRKWLTIEQLREAIRSAT